MESRPQHAAPPSATRRFPSRRSRSASGPCCTSRRTGTLATHSRKRSGFPVRRRSCPTASTPTAGRPSSSARWRCTRRTSAADRAREPARRAAGLDRGSARGCACHADRRGSIGSRTERGSRDDYLERHPNARAWVDFDDFAFYRMDGRGPVLRRRFRRDGMGRRRRLSARRARSAGRRRACDRRAHERRPRRRAA